MNSAKPRHWTVVLMAITAAVIGAGCVAGDYIYGQATGMAEIRVSARQFRAEAAPYGLHAASLVPGTDHLYRHEDPESPGFRRFRTDSVGTVAAPEIIGQARTTVLFLGGSTTECNEVEEPNRFPAVVQELLRKAGLDLRTINGGVRGHTTQDSLMSYLARPGYHSAQVVVLMHNINDRLWLSRFEDYTSPPSEAGLTSGEAVALVGAELVRTAWDYVSYRSNLLFALRQRLTHFNPWTGERRIEGTVSEQTVDYGTEQAVAHIAAFEENLRAFVALARARGALPVLMTQPLGRVSEGQKIFNEHIRAVATAEHVTLIDIDANITGDRSAAFLSDGIHFNDAGSRMVGGIIAQQLASVLGSGAVVPQSAPQIATIQDMLRRCTDAPDDIAAAQPTNARRIVGMPGRYPSFSADGRWLVFQSWRQGFDHLQALNVPKGEIADLSSSQGPRINERHPAILASGDHELTVVFGRGFNPEADTLERIGIRHWPSMKTDELFIDASLGGAIPAVSNGRVYFAGFGPTGSARVPDLMVVDPGAKQPKRLTQTPYEEWRPAPASDGTVFFIANPRGQFDIYALAPAATSATFVFGSDADEWDPAVSPDSRWLVFASKATGHWNLMLFDRKASIARPLTAGVQNDWDPQFHPSGKLIAFGRSTGHEPAIFGMCVFGEAH